MCPATHFYFLCRPLYFCASANTCATPQEVALKTDFMCKATADKDRWVSDPNNTLRPDLEQQDRLLDKLAEAWLFVLQMLVEEGADDK
jgi:hypothetical protein